MICIYFTITCVKLREHNKLNLGWPVTDQSSHAVVDRVKGVENLTLALVGMALLMYIKLEPKHLAT